MYNLTIENTYGQSLTFNQLGGAYTITEIEGLSPAEADIQTNQTALLDGEEYNSAKVEMRTINLAFAIEYSAEYYRLEAYKVLHVKKPVRVKYKSDMVDVYIDGYVKSFQVTHFEMKQIATVTILCPKPYWIEAEEIINELTSINAGFHFPFASTEEPELIMGEIAVGQSVSIDNSSSAECGMTIELYAIGAVTDPKVYNYVTQEFIGLDYSMQAGDRITITTGAGNKTATLLRQGSISNLFNYIMQDSTWLQLEPGPNEFVYTVGSGDATDLLVTFRHHGLREGV
jgi:hypothetical protein